MITRGLLRCALRRPHAAPRARTSPPTRRAHCRRYSASATGTTATAGGPQGTSAAMLAPFVEELDRLAPSFKIHGSRIRIIQTPTEFYETLKDKIRHAERRIFLSTLYIGKSEKDLIATLQAALRTKPDLKLSILTDALRGTRESPDACSASLLAPLASEFGPDRVEIRMYHTPNLTGMRKYIPNRINEGWGLQHMKLYGFDDEIILSGANLSTDYFTNRQDRYHMFSSRDITSYFWGLQEAVCSLSFLVRPSSVSASGFVLDWPRSNKAPSPLENPKQFVADSTKMLRGLISAGTPPQICGGGSTPNKSLVNMTQTQRHAKPPSQDTGEAQPDTSVYVLAQMSQLLRPDSSTELPALTHVLSTLASSPAGLATGSSWTFTAGYFNPAPSLTRLLLATVPAGSSGTVITASPYANGFYRSRGVSGMLPDAYSLLARRFLHAVERQRRGMVEKGGGNSNHGENLPTVALKEWRRGTSGEPGGWTYHAKGLWVTLGGGGGGRATGPSLTVIGSSNYTKRSYSLDLEANALVVTTNEGLRRRLAEEQAWLQEHAAPVGLDDFAKMERRVGLKVRAAMWIVSLVGGQL